MKSVKPIIFSVIILFVSLMTSNAQDWPQWRGMNRDGKVTGFQVPKTWPQQFNQSWKTSVGLGDATPALVNNKLYVFTRQGENEMLQCIDASTGKQIWQSAGYPTVAVAGPAASHPGPRSSPAISDGKIVTIGVAGDIACSDAATGKLLWRNEEYKGAVPQFYTGTSPLISSGVCFTNLGGPKSGQFIAFDLSTGTVKWKVESEGPAYGSPVLMTVDGVQQIVFQSQTKLVSLSLPDGKQLWEFGTPVGSGMVNNATSPVVDKNKIYYTGLNNGFSAIEIKKQGNTFAATQLWTNPDFSTSFSTPILKDGFLYGLSGKSRLFCINAGNGKTAWTDDTALQNFGSLVDAGSVVIALSSNSNFVVLTPDGQKFNKLTSMKLTESPIYAHPVLSGNSIFIKDKDTLTSYTVK